MSTPNGNSMTTVKKRKAMPRTAMSLTSSQRMLPLVAGIVREVQGRWLRIAELETEQIDLDRRRRDLAWAERARRYQVSEEIAGEQRGLQEAAAELDHLAVVLVDPTQGEAAFPTIINGRKAFFVWKLGDDAIGWWCYGDDATRRTIPASWRKDA